MGSELVSTDKRANDVIALLVKMAGGELLPPISNLVAGETLSRVKLYNIAMGHSEEVKSFLNVRVGLLGWIAQSSDETIREDGSVSRFAVTKMLTDDGKVIRSGSRGVAECLAMLTSIYGVGPWNPPVFVTPRVRSVSGTSQWYYLELDDEVPLPTDAKPSKGRK